MSDDINNCPCGAEAKLVYERDDDDDGLGGTYRVECVRCGAHTENHCGPTAKYYVIDYWNDYVKSGFVPRAGKRQPIVITTKDGQHR